MKYLVRIRGEERELAVDGEDVQLDGQQVRAHVSAVEGTPVILLSIGNQVHRVVMRRGAARGQYALEIGGFRFDVEALDERTRAIRALAGAAGKATGPATLTAPMPGLIVRVSVQEGDQVQAGQGLVVMEAMKMENELRAAAAGVVKKIVVSPGTAVEKGATLLEME